MADDSVSMESNGPSPMVPSDIFGETSDFDEESETESTGSGGGGTKATLPEEYPENDVVKPIACAGRPDDCVRSFDGERLFMRNSEEVEALTFNFGFWRVVPENVKMRRFHEIRAEAKYPGTVGTFSKYNPPLAE